MKGRMPKPEALKRLQGNPGKRPLAGPQPAAGGGEENRPASLALSEDAKRYFNSIHADLRRMNFIRSTDENALMRYAATLARYWVLTKFIDTHGESYEATTVTGEKLQRIRPEFVAQDRYDRRLHMYEDRFGLTPAARQQILIRLAQQPAQIPFALTPAPDKDEKKPPTPPPPGSAVGLLAGRNVH